MLLKNKKECGKNKNFSRAFEKNRIKFFEFVTKFLYQMHNRFNTF